MADGCRAVESRLEEAFLARREADAPDREHADGCERCGAIREGLRHLAAALDAVPAPTLAPEREAAARARAREALGRPVPVRDPRRLPAGYRRELARLLAAAAAPFPLAVALTFAVFRGAGALLAGFVPEPLLFAMGAVYVTLAASWLALIYGSIPLVAHRRSLRREREVIA